MSKVITIKFNTIAISIEFEVHHKAFFVRGDNEHDTSFFQEIISSDFLLCCIVNDSCLAENNVVIS